MKHRNAARAFGGVFALISVFGLLVAAAPPARALAPAIPEDVASLYSSEALAELRESGDEMVSTGEVVDFREARDFGEIKRIHTWSSAFLAGRSSAEPVAATEEWLAPILGRDGSSLGTYRVWRPKVDAPAEFAGYNNETELGNAMQKLAPTTQLVEDPRTAGWFALADGTVTALTEQAEKEVPYPAPVDEVMPIIHKRVAQTIADSEGIDGAVGGGGVQDRRPWHSGIDPAIWAGLALLIAGTAGAVGVVRRTQRRTPAE